MAHARSLQKTWVESAEIFYLGGGSFFLLMFVWFHLFGFLFLFLFHFGVFRFLILVVVLLCFVWLHFGLLFSFPFSFLWVLFGILLVSLYYFEKHSHGFVFF